MRTYKFIMITLALPFLGLFLMNHIPRSSGSPGGKTGSDGDGKTNCTQCHTSNAQAKEGWITTDIPVDGYLPGETYNLTLSAEQSGITRFGFELTAEKEGGDKIGSFDTQNNTHIKLVNSSSAVTHTSSGISATDGAKEWVFKWTAPVSGSGDVGFYAAVNAANADGDTSGDQIYTTSLKVAEQIDNSIENFLLEGWLKVYPNPANQFVRMHMNGLTPQDLKYKIFSLKGQLIISEKILVSVSNSVITIPVDYLPAGNYIIHFEGEGVNLKGRFLVIGK